jgi:tRNA(Met) cytidine acetyltransferase
VNRPKNADFHPVRLGITRGATSGTHSVVVIHPINSAGRKSCESARQRFHAQLPHLLSDPLRDLDPGLAFVLLQGGKGVACAADLDASDWREIVNFAFAKRGYESSMLPIWALAKASLSDPRAANILARHDREVLIGKVLQKKSWQEMAQLLHLTGRAAVIDALRAALRQLVHNFGPPAARLEAESLAISSAPEGRCHSERPRKRKV